MLACADTPRWVGCGRSPNAASRSPGWADTEPLLVAAYTYGGLLDGPAEPELVQVALVVDLPAAEATWATQPQSCAGLVALLGLDKAPVDWCWRPAAWPVANHIIRRPLRIWSATGGIEHQALEALARGAADHLRPAEPTAAQEQAQLASELDASLTHLREVESAYWRRDWRGEHRGHGTHPEHHLWNAVHGYLDLLTALQRPPQAGRRPQEPR